MKLFEIKNYDLILQEEVWGLKPFKALLSRDKTKNKVVAHAEMLFIYYYCDIRSDYLSMSEENRISELKKDIPGLDKNWKVDEKIKEAISFYNKFETVIERLYKKSLKAANDIGDYLENTDKLLTARDKNDKPIYDISKITTALDKVPRLMANLKAAYKEVVKEREDMDGRKKGSRSYNTFEEGLSID